MIYCISDVHGKYDLFCRLMDSIGFNAGDELLVLGDMTDKGLQTVRLCNLLRSEPNIHCITGNHEYDFLKAYYAAMKKEDADFDRVLDSLREYFPGDGKELCWEIIDWLESLPFFIERENFICVHAGIAVDAQNRVLLPDKTSPEEFVYSRKLSRSAPLPDGCKCVIFGHTPVACSSGENRILFYPRTPELFHSGTITDYCKIHIDTGAYLTGVMGCLRTDDCRDFYAFEKP